MLTWCEKKITGWLANKPAEQSECSKVDSAAGSGARGATVVSTGKSRAAGRCLEPEWQPTSLGPV